MTTTIAVVYVTFPSKKNAQTVVDSLLTKKLIACGTVFASNSSFVWQKKTMCAQEWIAVLKTTRANVRKVEQAIAATHKYDVPCILSWPVAANKSFAKWVRESCK